MAPHHAGYAQQKTQLATASSTAADSPENACSTGHDHGNAGTASTSKADCAAGSCSGGHGSTCTLLQEQGESAATPVGEQQTNEGDSTANGQASEGLDIRDLSWVDRERVLRLLFAKINGRTAERRAAALPPHAADSQVIA